MKKLFLIILFGSLVSYGLVAQNTTENKKIKYFKTMIYQHKDTLLTKGFLFEVKDSSVVVLTRSINVYQGINPDWLTEIPVKKIEVIKTRNKKSISTGVLAGLFTGFGLGLIAGSLILQQTESNPKPLDKFEQRTNIIASGLICAACGACIGATLGIIKSKYKINKNWNDYMLNAQALRNKSIKFQLEN